MSQYGSDKPILDARLTGSDLFTATANSETHHYFNFNFDCLFNGVELYAWDSNTGDKVELITEYYAPPLGAWLRYKKFGKTFNIYPNTLQNYILFPTEPKAGVRVKVTYNNTGNTDVKFSMNLFIFNDQQQVNTAVAEQGEDW